MNTKLFNKALLQASKLQLVIAAIVLGIFAPQSRAANIFMIGSSITDQVNYGGFETLAESQGFEHHWGRHIILGAPLGFIWNNPNSGFRTEPFGYYPNALVNYDWNAVTLQTGDSELEPDADAMTKFIDLTQTRPYNAENTEFFIFSRWPRQDRGEYSAFWVLEYTGGTLLSQTADYFNDLTEEMRSRYPDTSIRLMPVGNVMYELDQRMEEGLIPGFSDVYEFYADNSHLNAYGQYTVAVTYYSVIYRSDPRGLPHTGFNITPSTAALIQDAVWSVVTSHPLVGVSADEGLTITNFRLDKGAHNRPYTYQMRALFGAEPYTWSISSGELPNGLSLSSGGLISGTPSEVGEFVLEFTVTDNDGNTSTKELTLDIIVNTIPQITTQSSLPSGHQGTPYSVNLHADLGDPPLVWRRTGGALPLGLTLSSTGRIFGTPAFSGNFSVTVQVADDDFPADTHTRTFTLSVGPPEANTIATPRAASAPNLDGVLDEPIWVNGQTADSVVVGSTNNTVDFKAAWDVDYLYLGFDVIDSSTPTGTANDMLEVLLDSLHDRQSSMNVDDRWVRISRGGAMSEFFARGSGILSAVAEKEGGYIVEVAVPWSNLDRTPYAGMGIGFDLLNRDATDGADSAGVVTWNGSDSAAPAPATFGNLMLTNTLVGTPQGGMVLAYEPFVGPARPVYSEGVPLGFGEPWTVQNGSTDSYIIAEQSKLTYGSPLTFGQLRGYGLGLSGGRDYLNCGRRLDLNGVFADYLQNGTIGRAGTTLWSSWLVRRDHQDGPGHVAFTASSTAWSGGQRQIAVQSEGSKWRMLVAPGTLVDTGVSSVVGQTYLMVLKMEFGPTNTVSLYINPESLGGEAPATPTLVLQSTSQLTIQNLYTFNGAGSNQGSFDEFRIGTSYAAVTPVQPYPPIIDTQPQDTVVVRGSNVTLQVEAFSPVPVTYQWYKDGVELDGETASMLTIAPVTDADIGEYQVRVKSASGVTWSESAQLQFDTAPSVDYALWRDDGHNWANDDDKEPDADPDLDQISNIVEYMFDLDPLSADANAPANMLSGASSFEIEFGPVRIDSGISTALESSTNLSDWTILSEATINRLPVPTKPGFELLKLDVSVEPEDAIFIRMRIDH